ncbi:MAG: SWIM zinc finger domain-containing protein [Nocardiopsaceae bacterium]|nr:SWIM zinc finger domain-containing protein [Nocardiopsaceae bacterium]
MSKRWSADDVWALAPDTPSRKAAAKVARPASWPVRCMRPTDGGGGPGGTEVLWGECAGSGAQPYLAAVHLSAPDSPAYRCSCPSRKFPCKHALALLHLWAEHQVDEAAEAPEWVADWLAQRSAAAERRDTAADPKASTRRAQRREERIADGLAELELWLRDQVETGLAGARDFGYGRWDAMAARLVDAQAGRVADRVRDLSTATAAPDWPGRLLAEYALLRLLTTAYRHRDNLPAPLRATVRARVGLASAPEESVHDTWDVLGRHDFPAGQVRGRRFWLRGRGTGRTAMLVSFAPRGRTPESPVRVGTAVDAEVAFHPAEWRAAVVARHAEHHGGPPAAETVDEALEAWAGALAADPWLEAWPVVLGGAVIGRDGGWWLGEPSGAALPLHADSSPPWRLAAACGGEPATVAGEWTPRGLRPLTVWACGDRPVALA